ncbi:membrane protein [Anseongella ginsenosidimutans]|uniref:Membrane protein n=1 Tax=Anseongella ginsenosidimutans TaxID=496056 RepID=A0A4R3KMG0_9SPHI|nr:YihY/virulence factor BrkB family protein [Anseongella ginsenosidimutans]TCS85493.1 membrane protein [Anseongella ginsenosidimutans]
MLRQLYKTTILSIKEYRNSNPLQLASSTAFFTLFALPPILIILISVLGIIVKPDMLRGELFSKLSAVLGDKSTETVNMIFRNFRALAGDPLRSILGFLFLTFVATTLMSLIKRSINQLWHLKVREGATIREILAGRGLSFLVVLISGLLFLLSLVSDTFLAFLGSRLHALFPGKDVFFIKTINFLFSVLSITGWFGIIFKLLPNARIAWKPALVGGFCTALLFTLGKFILGRVLIRSDIGSVFGTSASVIVLLLFIFYSSLIFYYGAVFTKNYAAAIGRPVRAARQSVKFKIIEIEESNSPVSKH